MAKLLFNLGNKRLSNYDLSSRDNFKIDKFDCIQIEIFAFQKTP